MSVTLVHPSKAVDGLRYHLAGTLVWTQVTIILLLDRGRGIPQEDSGREVSGSKSPVKICIANCGQTVRDSGMVTIDSL